VIFYQNETEKMLAKQALSDLTLRGSFKRPVVTELLPLKTFWRAEEYHQDFIKKNPNQPYVKGVSMPRFEQFKKSYKPSKSK
jgi:peptide-methionine (S)-S-oxide reductase